MTGTRLAMSLPWSPEAPRQARRELTRAASAWGVAEAAGFDDARVVLSELVTNAYLHGHPPLRLVAEWREGELRLEVSDAHRDGQPELVTASDDDEGGRGLIIVAGLSTRWGCDRQAGVKVVWAEVAIS